MVKNALKDGRFKFDEKKKARQEGGPDPKVEEALFPEPVDIFMVDITKSMKGDEPEFEVKMKVVFPKVEEEIIDFLNMCKLKDNEIMLCQCCSAVFDR